MRFSFLLLPLLFLGLIIVSCKSPDGGSDSSDNSTTWSGTQQLGTSSGEVGYGVTVDSSGNIYVTGYTTGGLDGNTNSGSNCYSPPCTDIFLVKYNSSGVKQ